MNLIVVDPDQQVFNTFFDQTKTHEFEIAHVSDLLVAQELCTHTHPRLLICTRSEWAKTLAAANPRVPVVLVCDLLPSSQKLMEALRSGLADVWVLPLTDDFISHRISAILDRHRNARSQADVQLREYVNELQRDQRAGRYIQMGMLPPNPMAIDRYRLQHRIEPSLILSGDFVDYFRITDRHFAFYIADVSGHGASSAFVTVLLKNFSRRLRREYRPSMIRQPGEILEWINRELLEQKIDKHVVMILAIGDLQQNSMTLVSAGHFPPVILVEGEVSRFVEQRGKPVGLFENVHYEATVVKLNAGDRLVAFSDGVLDALGKLDLAHKEKILLDAARVGSLDAIWQSLRLNETAAPDDMTCLTVVRES